MTVNKLFGRRWKLTVSDGGGTPIVDTGFQNYGDPEGLRITFEVNKVFYSAWWYAEIKIFNLNGPTEQKVLTQGMNVTLEAGYQNGNYGVIFSGPIFQPKWERVGVTDFVVTLHCILPLLSLKDNFVNFGVTAKMTQRDLVSQMAAQAHTPLSINYLSPLISDKSSPRGVTLYGSPSDILDGVAQDNNMQWFFSEDGLSIGSLDEAFGDGDPTLVYCPAGIDGTPPPDALSALIGTPQQTQFGCNYRVLLDPRLKVQVPALITKLDMSQIRQMTRNINQFIGILDNDGIYKVAGLRHIGDTRGNEWYTDVTGVTTVGGKLAMFASGVQSLSGGSGS